MRYGTAFALVMVATALSSLNGLFVRSFDGMTDWQIVFWRHLILGIAIFIGLAFTSKGRILGGVRSLGWVGWAGALAFGLSAVLVTLAQHKAPIADVMFVLASVPFLVALLAWVTIGEAVHTMTWFAMTAALAGIGVMVEGNLGSGNLTGTLLGISGALMVAAFTVILRWGRALNMIPMFALGSLMGAAIALPFTGGDLAFDPGHLPLLLFWAALISPIYYSLFVIVSRHIPGAELMLALPIETIEATVLAWLVLGEIPSDQSMFGGAVVLAAVSALAWFRIRGQRSGAQ
jgi:DME family drug/metabolite transporter